MHWSLKFCLSAEGGGRDGILNKRFGTENTVSMSSDSAWYLLNTIKESFFYFNFFSFAFKTTYFNSYILSFKFNCLAKSSVRSIF